MRLLHGIIPSVGIATILLGVASSEELSSCVEGGFSVHFDGECNAESFLAAYETLFEGSSCDHTLEEDFRLQLGLAKTATDAEVNTAVKNICKIAWDNSMKVPFQFTHKKGEQFEQLYYNGGTYWNEEVETLLETGERTNHLRTDAARVRQFYDNIAQIDALEWPGYLPNFDLETCNINAAMCCWPQDRQANDGNGNCDDPYDTKCYDKDPADNTDLCFVDLSRSLQGNKLKGTGNVNFPHDNSNGEGAIHCHGFAWANDDGDFTSRFKANNLFYVSMYDHMHQRGYVRNVPGAPMCACVEQMPTVTRSDCTQIDVDEKYKIVHISGTNEFTAELTDIEIDFNACKGRYNRNNDLHAYVARLVVEGKLNNDQRSELDKYIVGNGRCHEATDYEMVEKGYVTGFNHDESTWFKVAGSDSLHVDEIGKNGFRELFAESPEQIVWRVCASCIPSHQNIYYKRYTEIPEGYDLLNTLLNSWSNLYNDPDADSPDFKIFSSYEDAMNDHNPWTHYSFRSDRGFPYESGPDGRVRDQWRTFSSNSGRRDVAFYVMKNPNGGLQRYSGSDSLSGVDIGNPYRTGGVLEKSGTYYITAAGNDISSNNDQFYYLQEEISGDLTVKAYLSSLNAIETWTKGGIMVRDTLESNSANFFCMQTIGQGVIAQWRQETGTSSGTSSYSWGVRYNPIWLMITRRGNEFTCSKSDDGSNWWPINHPVEIAMGETVHAGMALTSHRYNILTEAVFEQYEAESYYYPSASPSVSNSPSLEREELKSAGILGLCEGNCGKDSDCSGELICFQRIGFTSIPGCLGQGIEDYGYCIEPNMELRGTESNPSYELGICEGDCDNDSHCSGELVCFHRTGVEQVPGCNGLGLSNYDYCIEQNMELRGTESSPSHTLGLCEGDCDNDSDCADGLVCFQRSGLVEVPGCNGFGISDNDYCIEPRADLLTLTELDPSDILGKCEGDCDNDSECSGDLICFQRSGFTLVPGCLGQGVKDIDYCIEQKMELRGDQGNPSHTLGLCEGDCDNDSNCADGLVCFQRSGFTPVPGCDGVGRESYDYCIEPQN
jgi:hypothetical protein